VAHRLSVEQSITVRIASVIDSVAGVLEAKKAAAPSAALA